jgi:hypothetical protein
LSKLVFHFCAECWLNREVCEAFMRRAAGIPDPVLKEVADSARAKVGASAAVCALPESLARFIDDFDAVYELTRTRETDAA